MELIKKNWKPVVLTLLVVIFVGYYPIVKDFLMSIPLLKDASSQLPVFGTIVTGFGVIWYQRRREASERAKATLVALTYRLGYQYSATVRLFNVSIDKWIEDHCVNFCKFSMQKERSEINVSELAAVDGMTGLMTEVMLAEDRLANMRVIMHGINDLIDLSNNVSVPVTKMQIRKEIVESVREALDIVIRSSKDFKKVAAKLNSEVKRLKKPIQLDMDSIDEHIQEAEGLKRLFNKLDINVQLASVRVFLIKRENDIVYKYASGEQVVFSMQQLALGGVKHLVDHTSEVYGEVTAEELRVELLEWIAAKCGSIFYEAQKNLGQNENSEEDVQPAA